MTPASAVVVECMGAVSVVVECMGVDSGEAADER